MLVAHEHGFQPPDWHIDFPVISEAIARWHQFQYIVHAIYHHLIKHASHNLQVLIGLFILHLFPHLPRK